MTTFKDRVTNVLYLHHRFLVISILCIGGCVSLWAVYVFLFAPSPVIHPQEEVRDVSVKKEAIETVLTWGRKKLSQGTPITVPGNVFAVPATVNQP